MCLAAATTNPARKITRPASRVGRTDSIAQPAADHRSEEHADQEQGEHPGVVAQAVEITCSNRHCGRH